MNEFQYEVDNKATTKNTNYTIFLIIGIVIVLLIYNFFPNNLKDKEAAYSQIVDKLCGSAISYSEINGIKKNIPGETIYVKIGELQSSFLVTNKDLIDPRLKGEEAKIPSKAYVRLSLTQKGDLFCEGLINNEDDNNPPILSLKGSKEVVIAKGTNFIDPGAKAVDDYDGEVSSELQRSGTVNTNEVGEYEIKYISSDMAGNTSEVTRTIKVLNYSDLEETIAKSIDTINPVIEIKGTNPYCMELGTNYIEPGVEAKDNVDGNITDKIIVDIKTKENISGTYRVIYWVTDVAGNKSTAYRSVIVKDSCEPQKEEQPIKISNEEYEEIIPIEEKLIEEEIKNRINTKPQITLLGETSIIINVGEEYNDLGANAYDKEEGDLTYKIKIDSTKVKINKGGIYNVYYEVEDSEGLKGKAKRIVTVKDPNTISNVAIFNKTPLDLKIKLGHEEKLEKLTAKDSNNNDLNVEIKIEDSSGNKVNDIDYYRVGSYRIKYTATPKGGVSQTVDREIEIYDDLSPVLLVPSQIIEEVRIDRCEITEEYLYSKGLTTNDGNNKVMPKLVIGNSVNNFCTVGEFNISVYSKDDSNNKSEVKTIKIIVKDKNIVQDTQVPVSNVEITNCSNGKIYLKTNSTYQLNAIIYPVEATNKNVVWSSTDSDIVSVIDGNLSTSSVDGKAIIKVESKDGKSNECEVKVEKQIEEENTIPVESVEIIGCETGNLIIQKNTSKILSSKIKPENSTNKKVSWNSNGTNLSISSNGELKGINIGESTIELKSEDGNKTSLCKITVVEEPILKDETVPSKVKILSSNVNIDPYNKNGIWYGGSGKREIKLVLESIEKESKITKFIFLDKYNQIINEFYPLVNDNNKAEINWTKDINEEVSIISINSEGLRSEPSDLILLKLDNTGPITTYTSWIENPDKWTKETSVKVSYSSTDKLSGVLRYEYTHDDVKAKEAKDIKIEGTTESIEMIFNESNINKYVYVRAVDKLGNIGPWTEKPSYLNMDSVAPKAPTINILNNNTSKVSVGFVFSDSISTKISGFGKFEYKINSGIIKEVLVENETFDLTTEGTYRVDAWSYDKAGNKSTPSYKENIIVLEGETNESPPPLNKNVDISLNPINKGKSVPTNFLGFSTESGSLCELMLLYKNNLVMERLFTNLSPAVWRVGGNTLEKINWNKSAENCNNTTINSKLIDDMFAYASKINWKIIYGLNLKKNTLTKVKDESQYVLSKYNSLLYSIEIGNEPDLYDDWDYTTYIGKWLKYAREIKSLPYESKIAGPSNLAKKENYSDKLIFFENFIKDTDEIISSAAIHLYPLNGTTNDPSISAVDYKLNMAWDKNTMIKIKTSLEDFVKKAKKYSFNTRISETNNIAAGGVDGFSNTYATSLWTVDYLFTVLESGVKGVNFHGNFLYMKNTYSPIWSTPDKIPFATPNYYALLLFKQAANNGYSIPLNLNTSLNISAHAIENNNKKLQLVIINKETDKKAVVKVNTNTNYKSASAIRLTAPSLSTKITSPTNSQVQLGGKSVNADGSWSPNYENISVNNKYSTIIVPPISAILVTFEP